LLLEMMLLQLQHMMCLVHMLRTAGIGRHRRETG
jgi:hypothetical protein